MNVLIVKTTKTNGRAWAAWKITEESAEGLQYLISVNGTDVRAYVINDYEFGYFFGNDYKRAAFNLTELQGQFAKNIIDSQSNLNQTGWTLKFGQF